MTQIHSKICKIYTNYYWHDTCNIARVIPNGKEVNTVKLLSTVSYNCGMIIAIYKKHTKKWLLLVGMIIARGVMMKWNN